MNDKLDDTRRVQYSNEFLRLCFAERKRSLQWKAQEYDLFRAEKEHGIDWQKVDSLRKLHDPPDFVIASP